MRGYCESCAEEVESERDQYTGADECPNCQDDVHPGVHIENGYEEAETCEGYGDYDYED